jgi:geranylgeranylglycerol-phosphate geranylgeranyltransferase
MLLASNNYRIKAGAIAKLIRIDNCIIAAAYSILGSYLSNGLIAFTQPSVFGTAILVSLLVAFSCIINDYYDVLTDSYGKPDRPIPSGTITGRMAIRLAVLIVLAVVLFSITLGNQILILAMGCLVLGFAYSYRLKATVLIGNGTIALLNAVVPVFGGLASGIISEPVWMASGLTFFYVLAQEVLFTIEDETADKKAGLLTTATQLGKSAALSLYKALMLIFIIVALSIWGFGFAPNQYLYAIVPCTIIPVSITLVLLHENKAKNNINVAAHIIEYVWYSSIIPIILLR